MKRYSRTSGRTAHLGGRCALLTLTCLLSLIWATGCDSGNPVIESPTSPPSTTTTYTISVAVTPGQLEAGASSPASVSVSVIQDDTGLAPADGTLLNLDTDLGNFGVGGDGSEITSLNLALSSGQANANLFAPAAVGTATLAASVGISVVRTTVAIVEATTPGQPAFFITSISPQSGPDEGGQTVTLGGGGFSSPVQVLIGGATALVSSVQPSTIVATTPAPAMAVAQGSTLVVDVVVTIDLDTDAPRTVTLTGAYTYVADGAEAVFITSIDPTSGGETGGETVTISGGGFAAPARVTFGGVPTAAPDVSADGTTITAIVPAPSPALASGERRVVDVEVTSGLDQPTPSVATLASAYTYVAEDAPVEEVVLQSIDPTSGDFGGGTVVTVTGAGFGDPVAVELAGIRQSQETVVSETEVTFSTAGISLDACPAGGEVAQQGLTVTNLSSGVSGMGNFLFTYTVPEPRIRSVEPPSGPQVGNTLVTIFGTDFDSPVDVTFVAGTTRFSAEVRPGTLNSNVTVVLPAVDATIFPEIDCTVNNSAGKQFLPVNVDVEIVNLSSQCQALFEGGFQYQPTNGDCRPITANP